MNSKPYRSIFQGFSLLSLITLLLVTGCEQENFLASETQLSELESGWTALQTGGESSCGNGSNYHFFVHPGDRERVTLFFHGGGGCWDSSSCGERGTGIHQIIPAFHPDRQEGILDAAHPENPLSGYTLVALPYCTSDLHLGNRVATYANSDSAAGRDRSSFQVHHKGQANAGAVLKWMFENVPSPEQVVVTGSSAGAMAVPFYAQQIARRYPRARIVGIGDDAGAFRSEGTLTVEVENWGLPGAMERHPGWSEFGRRIGVERLYGYAVREEPNLELYMVNHAYDRDQALFLRLAGHDSVDTRSLIQKTQEELSQAQDSYADFILGGSGHTVLNRPTFYFSISSDQRLRDWVADIVQGTPVDSIGCDNCSRATYLYDPSDLKMIGTLLDLLDSADRWSRKDTGGRCPDSPDVPLSLRCAVVHSARMTRDTDPPPHRSYAAFFAFRDAVRDAATGIPQGADMPVIRFNNDPGTSFADVRLLLIEVRDRIRARLDEMSAQGHDHGD